MKIINYILFGFVVGILLIFYIGLVLSPLILIVVTGNMHWSVLLLITMGFGIWFIFFYGVKLVTSLDKFFLNGN